MNLLQKQFAHNLVKHNGSVAKAVKLSYITIPKSDAKKWMQTSDFQEYSRELTSTLEGIVGVDSVYVLEGYKKLYTDCLEGDARYDKDGNFLGMRPDRTNARGALDSMARMLGLDAPKEVNINVDLSTWLTQETIKPLIPKDIIDVEES